ncbi:MAG: acetylxylan esterase [Saprospiraceae bacterium]|nr:acetylxylan esterase [Saprospiraceae bacterium]
MVHFSALRKINHIPLSARAKRVCGKELRFNKHFQITSIKVMNKLVKIFSFLVLTLLPFSAESQVKISVDKAKATYALGEQAQFRIATTFAGKVNYQFQYDTRDDRSVIRKGEFTAQAGRLDTVVNFTMNTGSVVFCRAFQNGSPTFTTSASFDPLSIKPLESEPADFDAFWTQQKTILRGIAPNPQLILLRTLPRGSKLYILQLDNVNNRKTYGYLIVPATAGTHPAVVTIPPYGELPFEPNDFVANDFAERCNAITLHLSVHNTAPNVPDPNAYLPNNLLKADGYYNYNMIMGCLQAVEYLTKRSDFNGSLGVTGNSQGGGLAISVGGLDSRVSAVIAANPASSEQQGVRFNRASGFPRYVKQGSDLNIDTNIVKQTAKYHDVMYFAKRFKNPLLVLNGYKDEVTPPSTVFAAFNQHRGLGVILHQREIAHDYTTEFWYGRYSFFKQHLAGFDNPFDFTKSFDIKAGDDRLNVQKDTINFNGLTYLSGVINTAVPVRWEKIEGTGTVTFSNPRNRQTSVRFSTTGTYVLRFSAEDDYRINEPTEAKYYSFCDYIVVEVKSNSTKDIANAAELSHFKISPNPSNGNCQISWSSDKNYKTVRIYNQLGKLMWAEALTIGEKQVNLSLTDLPNSLYIAEIENTEGGKVPLKIIKNQ